MPDLDPSEVILDLIDGAIECDDLSVSKCAMRWRDPAAGHSTDTLARQLLRRSALQAYEVRRSARPKTARAAAVAAFIEDHNVCVPPPALGETLDR